PRRRSEVTMPTGRRRLASSLRAAEPSSPNEAKALSNNPADNKATVDDVRRQWGYRASIAQAPPFGWVR
ncbi:MAG: hypothetical protein WAV54_16540, partial [Acidimicrobiales bacterium]